MLSHFSQVLEKAKSVDRVTVAVAAAQDAHVLQAVWQAHQLGIAEAFLVGNRDEILKALQDCAIPPDAFEIVHVEGDLAAQSDRAVSLVAGGQAHIIMKGLVNTGILLKSVLNEKRLRTGRTMSAVGILETEHYPKFLLTTDAGMLIAPDLEQKRQILINALEIARALEIELPKVAVLCAKEKVHPKMQDTLDAQALVEMNERGELTGCLVGGPFALDNAVSPEAARQKGLDHPVAGDADIFLVPDLVSGNILYKSLVFLAKAKSAGIVVGAKAPIVLTSRADSEETKLNSIAVAALMA